jgi:hypothetical protein
MGCAALADYNSKPSMCQPGCNRLVYPLGLAIGAAVRKGIRHFLKAHLVYLLHITRYNTCYAAHVVNICNPGHK